MSFLQSFASIFPSLFYIASTETSSNKDVKTPIKPLNKKKKVKPFGSKPSFDKPKMIDKHITMKHYHTILDAVPRRMRHR